jgi:hypothetical protein
MALILKRGGRDDFRNAQEPLCKAKGAANKESMQKSLRKENTSLYY